MIGGWACRRFTFGETIEVVTSTSLKKLLNALAKEFRTQLGSKRARRMGPTRLKQAKTYSIFFKVG